MEFNVAYVIFSLGSGFSLHLKLRFSCAVLCARAIDFPCIFSGELQAVKAILIELDHRERDRNFSAHMHSGSHCANITRDATDLLRE